MTNLPADPCLYGQKDCPGGAQCVCALPRADDLLKLARFQILDRRNCNEAALEKLLFVMADEIERLRDLRVRLREAIELVKLHATTEHWTWIREVESELSDDVGVRIEGCAITGEGIEAGIQFGEGVATPDPSDTRTPPHE